MRGREAVTSISPQPLGQFTERPCMSGRPSRWSARGAVFPSRKYAFGSALCVRRWGQSQHSCSARPKLTHLEACGRLVRAKEHVLALSHGEQRLGRPGQLLARDRVEGPGDGRRRREAAARGGQPRRRGATGEEEAKAEEQERSRSRPGASARRHCGVDATASPGRSLEVTLPPHLRVPSHHPPVEK